MSAFTSGGGNAMWLLHPLVCYALLAAGLGLCLHLFVTLKVEVRAQSRRRLADEQQVHNLESALREAHLAVDRLESDLREVERQTGMLVAPAPARSGLNLSKRTQVLRMHRAGHDGAGIAASLGLPRGEVELLIKVHRIVLSQV
jgi:hypothetical protein